MNFLPTNYALNKKKAVLVLILSIIILGIIAYKSLPREWQPDINIPILVVVTAYPSSGSVDVESKITNKVENKLKSIDNLKKISSTSADGVSVIVLEFNINSNLIEAKNEVREAIDKAQVNLPEDAEEPIIRDINLSEFPIITFNISSNLPLSSINKIAEDIQKEIEEDPGVIRVDLIGGVEKEIQVIVDPNKLQYYNLSIDNVVNTIRQENVSIPGGKLEIGPLKYSVRIPADIQKAKDIDNIIINSTSNRTIYIKDIARVVYGFKDINSFSRVDGEESISLSVVKKSGYTITLVSDKVNKIIKKYQKNYPNLNFKILNDRSIDVKRDISDLENNILTGIFFVVLVLFLIMGFRNSLIVGFTIPLSMLISFIILDLMSIKLNFVVLFSLTLSLGMLVDNAVVIVENIFRHLENGKAKLVAIKQGVGELAFPIITSTLTTLAAFLPLLFMPDIIGKFIRFIPLVLIVTLSSSLLVALILNPIICYYFISVPKKTISNNPQDEFKNLDKNKLLKFYQTILIFTLNNRLLTVAVIIIAWISVIFSFGASNLGTEFFPKSEPNQSNINVVLPSGTNLSETNKLMKSVEERMKPFTKYTSAVVSNIGFSGGNESISAGSETGHLILVFPNWENWEKKPTKVIKDIRESLNNIPGAKITILNSSSGPPVGKAINIEVRGKDLLVLKSLTENIIGKIQNLDGLVNLKDNLSLNQPEAKIKINREKLAQYNIKANQIGTVVRTALTGSTVGTYRVGKDEYDITVRFSENTRTNLDDLYNFNFISPGGINFTLAEISKIERGPTFSSIHHINEERTVTISGDAVGKSGSNLLAEVKKKLADFKFPQGYSLRYTGEDESSKNSQDYIIKSFFIAIFLIFIILILQFNSISHAFIILSSVLLSLMGVFGGLLIHQLPFSIVLGGIGTVSLAGIVVNNSIVLLDYIEQLKRKNLKLKKAIIYACLTRFRPVMLTAITTILGLMPIVLGIDIDFYRFPNIVRFGSEGGSVWVPMSYAIIYGLSIATILTLVVIPVIYSLVSTTKISNSLNLFKYFFYKIKS